MAEKKHFDSEMVKAQKAARKYDWERFKEIFEKDKGKLLQPFDLFGNTSVHAVARSGNAKLLRELLEMLPEIEQKDALRKPNDEGNTLLHEAIFNKVNKEDLKMLDVIMEFDQKLQNEEEVVIMDSDQRQQNEEPLLEVKNNSGETAVSRAARFGYLNFLQCIQAKHHLQSEHFPPSGERQRPTLQTCILGFHFDVAVWLVKKVDKNLTLQKNSEGLTCLQLLSKMPMAFQSTDKLERGLREKLIYYLLPDQGYELELDDCGNNLFVKPTRDIECGKQDDEDVNPPKSKISVSSSINYAVWKLIAQGSTYAGFFSIYEIWERKKKHKLAKHLAKLLVNSDDSWLDSHNKDDPPLVVRPDFPPNVTEKRKEIELKTRLQTMEKIMHQMKHDQEAQDNETSWQTPLFLAAASGIIEVVKTIVCENPEAISHVNKDGINILHMAVKHRQLEIYEFIEESAAFESLQARITKIDGRTILHQAASMEYYREQVLPGVAYQLQDELNWYYRVKSSVPDHYLMHCDKGGITAGDLLDIEHAEMHDQAKQWMKETAQSCSTVAVLIAGVVFAAAYAIPGGTEGGRPVLHNSSAFRIFTIMDVVALACSLGSVVMFLSILTSSFDLWDFHKSLPKKLKLGFLMLFFSLICTMLAFAATILLTIRMEGNKKTTTFTYSLAFVIVSIFGLTQFPLYKMVEDQVKTVEQFLKNWKKKMQRKIN